MTAPAAQDTWPGLTPELLRPLSLIDSRRLTGPNVHSAQPTTVAEVGFAVGVDAATLEQLWRREAARMLATLGWRDSTLTAQAFLGGANFTLSASIDLLLVATEVNEWAVASAAACMTGRGPLPVEERATALAARARAAGNPRLLALEAAALAHDTAFLWDDATVSLGLGLHSQSFAMLALPEPNTLDWSALARRVPLALVTGTNGKTSCARLLARMAKEAGFVCGNTASDGIAIDGVETERGDWTGPAAARAVLRDRRVDFAVLETARGGILRRGLAVTRADAALITNVSADHFGGYGVDDLAAMARTKSVIARVVPPSGRVVLNADDAELVAVARTLQAPVVFFSVNADTPALLAHKARGGEACFVRAGRFIWASAADEVDVGSVADAPLTFSGRASYNVANALACIGMARALGLPWPAIQRALQGFGARPTDNPGRGTLYHARGVSVLVDFGHNPQAIAGVLALVDSLRKGGRVFVITGGAGDRSDQDLEDAARAVAAARPFRVLCRELKGYERGRAPGEVPALIARALIGAGLGQEQVSIVDSEGAALSTALAEAQPGDFVLLLVHLEHETVARILKDAGAL